VQIRKVEVPVNPRSDNIHPRKSQHALRKYFLAKHLTGNSVHEDEQPSQSRKRTVSPSPPLNSSQRSEQQRHQEKSTERSEKLRKMTSHRLFEFLETTSLTRTFLNLPTSARNAFSEYANVEVVSQLPTHLRVKPGVLDGKIYSSMSLSSSITSDTQVPQDCNSPGVYSRTLEVFAKRSCGY